MNLQSTATTPEMKVVTKQPSHAGGTRIRATTLLAWSFWALVIACATVSLILRIQNTAPLFSTYKGGGAGLLSELLYWEILIPLATPAYATVGAIVASRRPTNAVGWICLIGGLIIGLQDVAWQYAARALGIAPGSLPAGGFFAMMAGVLGSVEFPLPPTLLLLLFPTGLLVSRRWRLVLWTSVVCTALQVLATLFYPTIGVPSGNPVANPIGIKGSQAVFDSLYSITSWLALLGLLGAFISIVVRWRRARNNERQQLKWLAYICAMSAVTGALAFGSGLLPISPYTGVLIGTVSIAGLTLGIPITIGIAMLRHQLYDIDVIINRTLVYGSLTASLALVYFGLVIAFQALVQGITGQIMLPPIAIVASTLAIAALFQPLRKGIQAIIDRRFYRRKYDAARILEAFSASLRHEVDLNQLNEQLVAIVQESMQPTQVSLWLRSNSRHGTQNTQV